MNGTPIALFAFNRPTQLRKVLESVRALEPQVLYIFCDGPRHAQDESAVAATRELVDAIDWTDVHRVYRLQNLGLNQSIEEGLGAVFAEHERAIVIEDDVCVAPEFGEFATACLDAYADDPCVAAVTGLCYPIPVEALSSYPYDAFFAPRFSSWGWATWRRAWQGFAHRVDAAANRVEAAGLGADDLPGDAGEMLRLLRSGRLHGAWDVCCSLSILAARQEVVWPTWNMVVNLGLVEGTHAAKGTREWQLQWEPQPRDCLELPLPDVTDSAPRHALLRLLHEEMLVRDAEQPSAMKRVVRRLGGRRGTGGSPGWEAP